MSPQIPKTFCSLAWVHSFVNLGGEYQICCIADEFSPGISDANGKVFNIKEEPALDEVMNSSYMKDIRKKMLKGEWDSACFKCMQTEELGGTSRRQIDNQIFEEEIPKLIELTEPDGNFPVLIKTADYRLANLCNLQCRMCNPRSSVMWLKDWNEVKIPGSKEFLRTKDTEKLSSYDWINSPILLKEFQQKIETLSALHFAGGEPLIIPQMSRLLEICIEANVASKIELTYNTNLTQLPEKVLNLWKHFKSVKLLVSIDGHEKVNDYIRMPSKWSLIEKNLRFVDDRMFDLNISEVIISTTVQAYNVLNLTELYDFLQTFKNIQAVPNLVNLYSPPYLSTQILPPEAKAFATNRLQQIKHKFSQLPLDNHQYLLENIDQVIGFMNERDLKSFLPQFIYFTTQVDQKKDMKLSDYIPHLNRILQLSSR